MINNKIGNRIKIIREKADQNQKVFAKTMGVTPATINRYEKGHRIPDAHFLEKVVANYYCDPVWLLTGSDGAKDALKSKSAVKNYCDPDIDEIVAWLTEVPEAKLLLVRLVKTYREFDTVVCEIRQLGVRSLNKLKV